MVDAMQAAMREASQEVSVVPSASDQTVVLPRKAFEPVPHVPVDDATLDTIERRLARHIGPIARHLVRDAARKTDSVEALCETVSRNIPQPADRQKFLAESLEGSSSRTGMTSVRSAVQSPATAVSGSVSGGTISPEQIERAERALTKALGPIAKILVKRALPGVTSDTALWERLATHIQRAPDREAFLRSRPGG
jgi:serine/threonine-protein kinase